MGIVNNGSDYINLDFSNERKSNGNPTRQQRAVYNFHEARHSNEAEDIYTSTWFERTEKFRELALPTVRSTVLKDWDMIRDLAFGAFFLAHPIAGYSLWHFIHACDELDVIVCGSSHIESWLELKPFQYLERNEIPEMWQKSLYHLEEEVEENRLYGELLLQKLYMIFAGVEKLDRVYEPLNDSFLSNLEGKYLADQMMETIAKAYNWRSEMIANLSLVENNMDNMDAAESSAECCEPSGDEDLPKPRRSNSERQPASRPRPKSRGKQKKKKRNVPRKMENPTNLPSHSIETHSFALALPGILAVLAIIAIVIYNCTSSNSTLDSTQFKTYLRR